MKNRVAIEPSVLELEQTKHKVEVEVLSLEYRAARVFERLSGIEILDDEYETMSATGRDAERLQRETALRPKRRSRTTDLSSRTLRCD